MIGLIDGEQAASIALHAKHGFVQVGHLREVGFKFGRWLDVIYMQRHAGKRFASRNHARGLNEP